MITTHISRSVPSSILESTELTGYVHVLNSHVLNAPAGTKVSIDVPEAGATAAVTTDAAGNAAFNINAKKLTLCSPESPKLYNYKVSLVCGGDRLTDEIGFRDIRVDGTRILLNGKPIFLQGANMNAEAPVRGGRANTEEDVNTIFSYLQDLHANFVRLAHYPHAERMERAADREGIMNLVRDTQLAADLVRQTGGLREALLMFKEMIRRDRNKASVILWSVSNETTEQSDPHQVPF